MPMQKKFTISLIVGGMISVLWLNLKIPRRNQFKDLIIGFLQSVYCCGLIDLILLLTALAYWVFEIHCPGITLTLWEFATVMVVASLAIALQSVIGFLREHPWIHAGQSRCTDISGHQHRIDLSTDRQRQNFTLVSQRQSCKPADQIEGE